MNKKLSGIKVGDVKYFKIINPNWKHSIVAQGRVESVQTGSFNGMVKFKAGSIIQDEMLIRTEQLL